MSTGLLVLAPVALIATYILARYGRIVGLILWGFIKNKLDASSALLAVSANQEVRGRLKGKTCLVTGANRGLGRGIAVQLAAFGARVIAACRSGVEDAPREIAAEAAELIQQAGAAAAGLTVGSVEAIQLDVSNSKSVERLVAELKKKGVRVDFFVTNAAVVPLKSESTSEGLEAAFATNFFGHWLLANRLVEERVLALPTGEPDPNKLPRVVVVASESHRISKELKTVDLLHLEPFSISTAMNYYAFTKMLLVSFAFELARRINQSGYFGGSGQGPRAVVRVVCPGPVDSNIAHHAPQWLQTLIKPMFKLFFAPPLTAARAVVGRLSEALPANSEPLNAMYYHILTPKDPRPDALDPTEAARLWGQAEAIRAQLQQR